MDAAQFLYPEECLVCHGPLGLALGKVLKTARYPT
jgi:cytochrome c